MADKKSSIMREREKARQALVELKTAEREGKPLPQEDEEKIVPRTFGEKAANFWYHNKFIVMGAAALALVAAVCFGQIISRPKYDANVVVYLSSFFDINSENALKEELEKLCPDVNGDGQSKVMIINCSVYEEMNATQQGDNISRMQAQLLEGKNILFIVDEKSITQLDSYASGLFQDKSYHDLNGRGIKLNGTPVDDAVQAADTFDLQKLDYYILSRSFSENSIASADEDAVAAAREIMLGIKEYKLKVLKETELK